MGTSLKGMNLLSEGANSFLYEQFLILLKITFITLSDLPWMLLFLLRTCVTYVMGAPPMINTITPESKWVWSGNTAITHCRPTHGTVRKSQRTLTAKIHQEDKTSKATSSFFLVKMIAKLERTLSNALQKQNVPNECNFALILWQLNRFWSQLKLFNRFKSHATEKKTCKKRKKVKKSWTG